MIYIFMVAHMHGVRRTPLRRATPSPFRCASPSPFRRCSFENCANLESHVKSMYLGWNTHVFLRSELTSTHTHKSTRRLRLLLLSNRFLHFFFFFYVSRTSSRSKTKHLACEQLNVICSRKHSARTSSTENGYREKLENNVILPVRK